MTVSRAIRRRRIIGKLWGPKRPKKGQRNLNLDRAFRKVNGLLTSAYEKSTGPNKRIRPAPISANAEPAQSNTPKPVYKQQSEA